MHDLGFGLLGGHVMLLFVYSTSISQFTFASENGPCPVIFGPLVMLTQALIAAICFIVMQLLKILWHKKHYPEATFLHHAPYTIYNFYGIQDC